MARETIGSCSTVPLEFRLRGSSVWMKEKAMHISSPRSTSIMDGPLEDLPVSATFQSGNTLKLNMRGSSPPFSPSGQTPGLHIAEAATHISGAAATGVLTR